MSTREPTELEARAMKNAYIDRAGMDPAKRKPAAPLYVGGVVMVYSRGNYRWAIVERIGPKRVQVVLTTPGALRDAAKYGGPPQFTRKPVPIAEVFEPVRP